MTDFMPFVIAGIASGALYGLAATGLVLTYKSSGIFNLAHGGVAAAGAYFFHELRTVRGLPWPVALALTLVVFAPAIGLLIELLARGLRDADTATRIVATVGLLLAIQGVTELRYGAVPLPFEPFLSTSTFRVAGTYIGYDQLGAVVISGCCVGALLVFFRRTRLGLQMRAVVDNPELLGFTGQSPAVVRRWAWAIGCSFAALSGILLAATVGLNATFLTLLVVQAFGAAAVGRFQHIGITYAAALGIGVAGEVIKKYVPGTPSLAGLPPSLPFLVLFGVLVLSPAGRFRHQERRRIAPQARSIPPTVIWLGGLAAAGVIAGLPNLVGTRLPVYTNAAIYVVLFVSLALLVQLSGQVSLCQLSFAAVGATTFSRLTVDAGIPWLPALVLAGLVVVPVGAFLAIPAIRLASLYLGLATFGFAILLEQFVFGTFLMFGAGSERRGARPDVLGMSSDRGYFYLCAAIAVSTIILALVIARTRLGRLLRGLADSPVALATHGANISITRVLVFCVSSFLAAVAGALLLGLTGTVSASGTTFGFFQSLMLLAVLSVAGRSLAIAPVMAAWLFAVAPTYSTNPDIGAYQVLGFGSAALLLAIGRPALAAYVHRAGPAAAWRTATSPVNDRRALLSDHPAPA